MPPPPSPYVLEQRLALPDQDWQPVGRYGALESAAEDARWPLPRPAEGTLRRVTLGRYTVWIGVADDQGEVLPLPTVATRTGYRTPPGRVKDWLAAWYGPKADWRYMLDQAHGVEREWLVALALVFAERALAVREASDPPLRDGAHARSLIEATRAWLRGEGGREGLGDLASDTVQRAEAENNGISTALESADHAAIATGSDWPETQARSAAHFCLFALPGALSGEALAEGEAFLLEQIRRMVPLGAVLAQRLRRHPDERMRAQRLAARGRFAL